MIRCAHRLLAGIALVVFASSGVRVRGAELKRYLAIRDSFATQVPKWPSQDKIDWKGLSKADSLVRDTLDSLVRPIAGVFDVAGFVQPGRYNVDPAGSFTRVRVAMLVQSQTWSSYEAGTLC